MSRRLTKFEMDCAGKFYSVLSWSELELSEVFTDEEQRIIENAIQQFDCPYDVARFKQFSGPKSWSLVFDRKYIQLAFEQLDTDEESRPGYFKAKCKRIARNTPFGKHWHKESIRDYCRNEGLKLSANRVAKCTARLNSFSAFGSTAVLVDDIEFLRNDWDRLAEFERVVVRDLWPHWMLAAAFGINSAVQGHAS